MVCPKCKGTDINVTDFSHVPKKKRSFLWNLFMFCITCGLWLIWMLIRNNDGKAVHESRCVCQTCGYNWKPAQRLQNPHMQNVMRDIENQRNQYGK